MRILDKLEDRSITDVLLLLTRDEAKELMDSIGLLMSRPELGHIHVADFEAGIELAAALYDAQVGSFAPRVVRLIEQGE